MTLFWSLTLGMAATVAIGIGFWLVVRDQREDHGAVSGAWLAQQRGKRDGAGK